MLEHHRLDVHYYAFVEWFEFSKGLLNLKREPLGLGWDWPVDLDRGRPRQVRILIQFALNVSVTKSHCVRIVLGLSTVNNMLH